MAGWRHKTLGGINRDQPLKFTFDGKPHIGYAGDTIASALLASGTQIVGRSFKYHRPRGIVAAGGEEPNAIVDLKFEGKSTPNLRATTTTLLDGMEVRSVNASPTADSDRARFIDWANKFLPGGFYYKTFMFAGWMRWEPMIRKMAGLGHLDDTHHPLPDIVQLNATCDLLVIGAGPAGLAAANAAARNGQVVWLLDEADSAGGSLRWHPAEINKQDGLEFADKVVRCVQEGGGKFLNGTTVWGAFDHGLYSAFEKGKDGPDRHWRIRPGKVVIASGAIERPLWFANNDLPGVMLAEAGLEYANRFGAIAGKKIALATANDSSYLVADILSQAGVEVTLFDARSKSALHQQAFEFDVIYNSMPVAASGRDCVSTFTGGSKTVDVDAVLVSGGFTPSVHLWCQAGGKLDWNEHQDVLVPRGTLEGVSVVGAANGTFELEELLKEGHFRGGGKGKAPSTNTESRLYLMPMRPDPELPGRQWIDFQNDVTLKDIALAEREGFRSVEHLKRYTTLGMATDQGKTSNFAGLAAMSALTGKSIPETGTTTYRPPFAPIPLLSMGGRRRANLFNPLKRLPLEGVHREAGAVFREYGGWLRPAYYGSTSNEAENIRREALLARSSVGIYDASPLGKLEVLGPNAASLMDFTNYIQMSTLKNGRARYGFVLSENGIVYDDGVVMRLADNRFIMSASSSHVDGVRLILEEIRQDRLQSKDVVVQDLTANWTTLSVTGPKSKKLMSKAGIDVQHLRHMDVVETVFRTAPIRIARVSFTGDMCFELSVPSRYGGDLEATLVSVAAELGGGPIGLEAVMMLRAEKGYILIGKDTDGSTMPQDLGWSGPRNKREDEFQGKRSLFTEEASKSDRRQLVGLQVPQGAEPIAAGAHLIPKDPPRRSLGFVTSSHFSPTLGIPVALALLEDGRKKIGGEVLWFNNGQTGTAQVVSACAYDPKGELLDG